MISINATIVVQVIHFLILVFILNRLMFRPILRLIVERTQYFEETRNEIESIESETERAKNEYLLREINARRDAAKERSRIKDIGITKAEEFLDKSRQEVSSIRTQVDKRAEEQLEKARPVVPGEAGALAEEILERVIGRRNVG